MKISIIWCKLLYIWLFGCKILKILEFWQLCMINMINNSEQCIYKPFFNCFAVFEGQSENSEKWNLSVLKLFAFKKQLIMIPAWRKTAQLHCV